MEQCIFTRWNGLVIGYIDHLQNVTTSNYSAIANSHILQFTIAHIKHSQSVVFTSRFLVMVPNNVVLTALLTHCCNCRLSTKYPGYNISVQKT
jgi:ABC-type lipoprotein release transport system permease subunit